MSRKVSQELKGEGKGEARGKRHKFMIVIRESFSNLSVFLAGFISGLKFPTTFKQFNLASGYE